jgi:nitrogen-specific signal transduction histidine kinase
MSADFPIHEHADKIRSTVNNDRRLKAVKKTSLINSLEEESFDRLTRLASKLLKTPISFVTLLEKDRDFVKSHYGLPTPLSQSREITAHPSFCQHIVDSGQPLVLEDARDSEIFKYFPSVQHLGVVAYAGIPLITQQGYVLGTCCVVDYKKRIWTDDELEILLELSKSVLTEIELREAASNLDDFVAIAAHEIKTPLTSMKAYSQLIEQKSFTKETADLKNYAGKISEQVNRLELLVDRLFDSTAIKNGEVTLIKESWDLNKQVSTAVNYFENQTSQKFILHFLFSNLTVCADKDKITQVVTNLIGNAIKYAPESKTIEISVTKTDTEAIVSVKDYGPGISEADCKKVFDRFYRSKSNTKTIGLGLGLYICKDIIEAHNGTITVMSVLGEGSVFSFTLPL